MDIVFLIVVLLTIFAVAVAIALLVLLCAYLVWADVQKEYEL
nr:MAG TPA: hypothetical protein [Bacteriophage sp.]